MVGTLQSDYNISHFTYRSESAPAIGVVETASLIIIISHFTRRCEVPPAISVAGTPSLIIIISPFTRRCEEPLRSVW